MLVKRRWALAGIGLGVALLAYAVLAPESDEEKIAKRLGELSRAVNWDGDASQEAARAQRINALFRDLFLPQCDAQIPDLPSGEGSPAALAMLAMGASRRSSSLVLTFERVTTRVAKDKQSARTTADAVLTVEHEGRLDKDKRHVAIEWLKRAGTYRILELAVAPVNRDQPEARP